MNKLNKLPRVLISGPIVIGVLALIAFFPGFLAADTITENTQSEFNAGVYSNTVWDTDHIELTAGQFSGTYTSPVFTAADSGVAQWQSMGWTTTRPTYKEIANNNTGNPYAQGGIELPGIVLLFHFNQLSGETFIESSNNYNGTCSGTTCPDPGVDGKFNTAVEFDGNNEFIALDVGTLNAAVGGSFFVTITAWVYAGTGGGSGSLDNVIFDALINGTDSGAFMNIDPSDGYKLQVGGRSQTGDAFQSVKSSSFVPLNQWVFVAGVIDIAGGRISTYINGDLNRAGNGSVVFGSIDGKYIPGNPTRADYIGKGSGSAFKGKLDEVMVLAKELNASQIMDVYLRGALQLKYQVKTCDDPSCAGETFVGPDSTGGSFYSELANPNTGLPLINLTGLSDQRFFQYIAYFNRDITAQSPELHDIHFNYALYDPIAPGNVADLSLAATSLTTLQARWTAPGDDNSTVGTASSYDIRYSTAAINDSNWDSATQINSEPAPAAAGTSQTVNISGLSSGVTYYVALKTADEVPNVSGISNVPSLTMPLPDSTPPDIYNISTSSIGQNSALITWSTNEAATSQVEYGLNLGYGNATDLSTDLVTSHSVNLTDLQPGTLYHFRAKSKDASANQAASINYSFTTLSADTPDPEATPTPAESAPDDSSLGLSISNLLISNTTAFQTVVSWTTNRTASAQVLFGTSPGSYLFSTSPTNIETSQHQIIVTNLSASTTYYFVARSADTSGRTATSGERSFRTTVATALTAGSPETTVSVTTPGSTTTSVPILATDGDETPPIVNLDPIGTNIIRDSRFKISGVAEDEIGVIESLAISLDEGATWHAMTTVEGLGTQRAAFIYQSRFLADDDYLIIVRALDNSENEGRSETLKITLDLMAPVFGAKIVQVNQLTLPISQSGTINTVVDLVQQVVISAKGGPTQLEIRASVLENDPPLVFPLKKGAFLGLWTGEIAFPAVGSYQSKIIARDSAGNVTQGSFSTFIVHPPGFITDQQNQPINNVTASLRQREKSNQVWVEWPGTAFGQTNPQWTNAQGQYSFFLPPGRYYLDLQHPGYRRSVSQITDVSSQTLLQGNIQLSKSASVSIGPLTLKMPNWLIFAQTSSVNPVNPIDPINPVDSMELVSAQSDGLLSNYLNLPAPSFEISNGKTSTMASFLGSPTVISLWNTWDGVSQEQIPILEEVKSKTSADIVPLVLQEDHSKVANYLKRGQYQLEGYVDYNGHFSTNYPVLTVPQHFFIDADGILRDIYVGKISADTLKAKIDQLY